VRVLLLLPLRKASRIKCSELAEITGEKPRAPQTHLPDTSRRKNWLHRFEINKSG
jgi:hypothetical protein